MPPETEAFLKVSLGAATVFYGLRLTWISVGGSIGSVLLQLLVVVVALMIGKQAGRLLRLQKTSNRLGQRARQNLAAPKTDPSGRFNQGFETCALLFCAAPLGILGSVHDGLSGYFAPLVIKAVVDGLATFGFVSIFGWGVMTSALPVLALQGSITLLCSQFLKPLLETRGLLDSVNATGGLLIFSVALVILGLKKLEVTDYLPSLAAAPLLTWLLR
jgi:uncharacterized membrane protein YqgA involved in biofilm formation